MVQARYSDSQLRALDEARFCQKTDAINRRINVIYFWGLGHTQLEATRLANVSPNTLRKSAAAFASGGLAAVVADGREGPPSALDPHAAVIKADFAAHPPGSLAQAADRIAQLTGVRRQPTQVRIFMRGLGMAPRRLSPIPGKADPMRQADFKKTSWILC
ncbi:MAG: helix-turn-helix domain-containing protein [Phycisphaerae bacterium]